MGTFLNAVKNLFNSLTEKTKSTASTADLVQLHNAAGNPNGKINLDNLASVLGGMRNKGSLTSSDDLNDKQTGFYACNTVNNGTPRNVPAGFSSSFVYVGLGEGTTWGAQIIMSTSSSSDIYIRTYVLSALRDWKKVSFVE